MFNKTFRTALAILGFMAFVLFILAAPTYDLTTTVVADVQGTEEAISPTYVHTYYSAVVTWMPKEDVPTLLCIAVDPWGYGSITGDQMYDCGNGPAATKKERKQDDEAIATVTDTSNTPLPTKVAITNTPPPSTEVVVVITNTPPPPPATPEPDKQKCNKGDGNGAEGCDPGNHPEKGNDDEDDAHINPNGKLVGKDK
jgi:hypothetical protein